MSSISVGSDVKKRITQRKLSNPEMAYSTSSQSTYRQSKKLNKILNHTTTQYIGSSHYTGGEVRQRIMSAQMLKLKQLQNKLGDAHIHINELTNENRLLKQLQKKQDSALNRYEHSKSELPQLLRSHDEDVRIWQNKCRHFKEQLRLTGIKLKEKEQEIITLTDQYKHLQLLSTNRNLGEREQLSNQVRDLQDRITQQDNTIAVLQRKLTLETKNVRAQLATETNKHKETKKELELASAEVTRLLSVVESRQKYIATSRSRLNTRNEKSVFCINQLTTSEHSASSISHSKNIDIMMRNETKLRNNFLSESTNAFGDACRGSDTSTSREVTRRTLKRRIWAEPTLSSSCSNESSTSVKNVLKPIAKAKLSTVANNKLTNNKDKLLLDIKKGISELAIESKPEVDESNVNEEPEQSPENEILEEVKQFEEMFKAKEDLSVEQRIELMKQEMREKISQETIIHDANIEFSNINSARSDHISLYGSPPVGSPPIGASTSPSSNGSRDDQISEDSNGEFDDNDDDEVDDAPTSDLANPNESLREHADSWKSIETEISAECQKSEAMLENHCQESIADFNESMYKTNCMDSPKSTKKHNIDPEKKKNLLEALKKIDNDKKLFK